MSLGTNTAVKRIYLNIKDGKIKANNDSYEYVTGLLERIYTKDREFNGEKVKYWYIDLKGDEGEAYSLALSYNSGIARSLFNCLASVEDFSKEVKIKPYIAGEYTKVVVYSGETKLDWKYSELPPIELVTVGLRAIKDDSKRMSFFINIVNEINKKIQVI